MLCPASYICASVRSARTLFNFLCASSHICACPNNARIGRGCPSLTSSLDNTAFTLPTQRYKRCRKLGPVESKGVTLGSMGAGTAEVVFASHKDARSAAGKLQGKTLKGGKLSAVLKTRANQLAPAVVAQGGSSAASSSVGADAAVATAATSAAHAGNTKRFRLIVRNLPFTCNDAMLRKACSKFGPVLEVTVVKDSATQKPKGFAFVQCVMPPFTCLHDESGGGGR
jgi:hypothetical protein